MAASTTVLRTLNRPQYVPTPETLISALAWDVLEYSDPALNGVGWRYMGPDEPSKKPPMLRTATEEMVKKLEPALSSSGFQHAGSGNQVAHAVAMGIAGVKPTRSKSQAASPMTPGLALLQNPVGMTGAPHPANYASILEALYRLGATDDGPGVAERWLAAARLRTASDPILAVLDDAFTVVRGPYREKEIPTPASPNQGWDETPFGWFHDSWNRVTSEEWVSALPPRVWTDWATSVLRLAVATGYLWECERYSRICRAAVGGRSDAILAGQPERDAPFELVPWPSAHLPVSTRNVRAILRRKAFDGGRLRNILLGWEDRHEGEDPRVWITTEGFRADVQDALTSRDQPRYLKNLYETIIYSLLRRDVGDHYGLLSARGNAYAVASPGTEWIAVVASLAAGSPGAETHVGAVVRDLGRLGLQPRLPDLIRLLEGAGLARGSADADHGVRVSSAF